MKTGGAAALELQILAGSEANIKSVVNAVCHESQGM